MNIFTNYAFVKFYNLQGIIVEEALLNVIEIKAFTYWGNYGAMKICDNVLEICENKTEILFDNTYLTKNYMKKDTYNLLNNQMNNIIKYIEKVAIKFQIPLMRIDIYFDKLTKIIYIGELNMSNPTTIISVKKEGILLDFFLNIYNKGWKQYIDYKKYY